MKDIKEVCEAKLKTVGDIITVESFHAAFVLAQASAIQKLELSPTLRVFCHPVISEVEIQLANLLFGSDVKEELADANLKLLLELDDMED